jgi:hypothetical protein
MARVARLNLSAYSPVDWYGGFVGRWRAFGPSAERGLSALRAWCGLLPAVAVRS